MWGGGSLALAVVVGVLDGRGRVFLTGRTAGEHPHQQQREDNLG